MDGKHCLRQFSWEKTPVISYVSAWFFVMPSQLRKPYLPLVSDRHLCDSGPLWPGGGREVGTLLMKGKVSLWDTAVEPVCVCVSLHHLHLNAYSPLTFLQLDGLKWCLASANTHISMHTLTQEATALITDHTRKVCHYFKCRKFFKVHELLKSAFGQNSVSCLKGIPPCACGFLRFEIQLHVCSYFHIAILDVKAHFEILLSLLLYSSLSAGIGPPLSRAFVVVMRAVTLTLVRVGSHVSPLVETESVSFPLGKVGSVFLHTSFSHVSFPLPLLIPGLFFFLLKWWGTYLRWSFNFARHLCSHCNYNNWNFRVWNVCN